MKIIHYQQISRKALTTKDALLLEKATAMTGNSYSPYSYFAVGAAVFLDNGEIVEAANQENAAYPSGLCAERIALFFAGSKFPDRKILAIAISAKDENGNETPISPCGACLQVMLEYEQRCNHKMKIIFPVENGEVVIVEGVENMLPFAFSKKHLH